MVSLYEQESANRRNSLLLVFLVMIAFALFGYVIGYALTGDVGGAVLAVTIALGFSVLSAIGSYFGGGPGRPEVVACAGAQPGSVSGALRRRRGDGDCGRHPDAPRLPHRRPVTQCVRDGS